ncbi:MAG: HipA domain-containing protein [Alphaproteobacteria bacterium]|nr:HipA domain-containing protein [Alphaproteobacteria bacterium]
MNSKAECYVYIVPPGGTEFVTAGRFRLEPVSPSFVGTFVYGRNYRERKDAVELDPVELRLTDRTYETARMDGFFGAIRDAMPDFWGRRIIEKHAGLVELEEFDYLMKGPDDRAGALGFGLNVEPPAPQNKFNRTLDLEKLQRAADALIADEPDNAGHETAQAQDLLLLGTSMGGARPKTVVQDGHDLWLAKFSRNDDRWNYPRVEHAMLTLAQSCGLNTADSRIDTIGGRDVLLVRRFDRDWAKTGYRRHRMVSALTLLRTGDSPAERQNWSYLLLADELRRVSADPEYDLRELFGRICFNAAVSNIDDHPRNHAIIAKERDWRLSPAFDLTPTPTIAIERRDLAMACGRYGRYANQTNLLSDHGRFLLNEGEAHTIFTQITTTIQNSWHATMRRAGVSDPDCEAIKSAFVYDGLFYEAGAQDA